MCGKFCGKPLFFRSSFSLYRYAMAPPVQGNENNVCEQAFGVCQSGPGLFQLKEAFMKTLVPFAFWVASAVFLACAYAISPPDMVKGLSSTMMGNAVFLIATCCLIIHTYNRGRACRGCSFKKRRIKRIAFTLLSGVVLYGYLAILDLVKRGRDYINMPILVFYGLILFLLVCAFFGMRHWYNRVD